jgi:hypothetical protein
MKKKKVQFNILKSYKHKIKKMWKKKKIRNPLKLQVTFDYMDIVYLSELKFLGT